MSFSKEYIETLRRGDEREVDHNGLGFHGVGAGDGVGHVLELGGVAADEDEVQAAAGELQGDGLANAGCGAGDHGPGAIAAAEVGGATQQQDEVGEDAEGDGADVQGAKDGERDEPCRQEVGAHLHSLLSLTDRSMSL